MINSISSQVGSLTNYYSRVEHNDKIEVPVPSSVSVYAQFKYVRGVPASSAQQPVSLSRAQIIDNMVSYLNNSPQEYSLNKNEEYQVGELESEIHKVVNDEPVHFNSIKGGSADTGIIFNLTA